MATVDSFVRDAAFAIRTRQVISGDVQSRISRKGANDPKLRSISFSLSTPFSIKSQCCPQSVSACPEQVPSLSSQHIHTPSHTYTLTNTIIPTQWTNHRFCATHRKLLTSDFRDLPTVFTLTAQIPTTHLHADQIASLTHTFRLLYNTPISTM